jgi:hypothetical protein
MPGATGTAAELLGKAVSLLVEDIGMLHRGTDLWIQGVNYLVTLHWCAGAFDLALRWFSESLQRKRALAAPDLVPLTGAEAAVPPEHPQHRWLFLNQLRLCALGHRQGQLSPDAEALQAALGRYCGLSRPSYPDNLAIKWLLVLAGPDGVATDAIWQRVRELLAMPRGAPILELMRAVELSLLAALRPAGRAEQLAAAQGILAETASFGRFGEFLAVSTWANAVRQGLIHQWHPYDIATALPYYYS